MKLLIYDFMEESLISCTTFVFAWSWDIVMGDHIVLFLFDPGIWFHIHLLDMNPNFFYLYLLDMNPKFYLSLFVRYESKFYLSLFIGSKSKILFLSFFYVVGYESKFWYVSPSSILLDMNPNSIYFYLLDVNPKFCLFLFVGYKSKFCLSLFVGCESKFCLALFVGYESKFCLSLVLLFFILLWLRVFFFYLYSLISHYW